LVPGARTTGLSKMIKKPGLVLKYRNRERFVIRQGYETALHGSSSFCLTVPNEPILVSAMALNLTGN